MEEIKIMKERKWDIFALIYRKWKEKGRIKNN
jgi:hypothetical protein